MAQTGSNAGYGTEALSAIPQWEADQLVNLASAGKLGGLDPNILAAIDVAESSGTGGSINSEGYGGYYGLGANSQYPGGHTSPAMLSGTDANSFDSQSIIAASEFNSLLNQSKGNTAQAEYWYQNGGGAGPVGSGGTMEGVNTFVRLGVPGVETPSGATATLASAPGGSSSVTTASGTFAAFLQQLDGFFNPTVSSINVPFIGGAANGIAGTVLLAVDRGLGVVFGIGLIYLGVKMVGGSGIPGLPSGFAQVYTARTNAESRERVAGQRAAVSQQRIQSQQQMASDRQAAAQARDAARAAAAAQSARERADRESRRQSEADRRHKIAERRAAVSEAAEQRRSAEDRNAGTRRASRPSERKGR